MFLSKFSVRADGSGDPKSSIRGSSEVHDAVGKFPGRIETSGQRVPDVKTKISKEERQVVGKKTLYEMNYKLD